MARATSTRASAAARVSIGEILPPLSSPLTHAPPEPGTVEETVGTALGRGLASAKCDIVPLTTQSRSLSITAMNYFADLTQRRAAAASTDYFGGGYAAGHADALLGLPKSHVAMTSPLPRYSYGYSHGYHAALRESGRQYHAPLRGERAPR